MAETDLSETCRLWLLYKNHEEEEAYQFFFFLNAKAAHPAWWLYTLSNA
jgi:hypothetical protein